MDLRALLRLETRDLCYFIALAEELHFSRAAERVGINQSPFSQAIMLLEHRLGVRLFQRNRRRTALTEVGATLVPPAKSLLESIDRLRKDIAALAAGRKGRLRIGASDGLSVSRVAQLLMESSRLDPQIEFSLEHRSLALQLRELRQGMLDVGLASNPANDLLSSDMELQAIALHADPIVLALRPDHFFAEQGTVRSLIAATGPYFIAGEAETMAASVQSWIESDGGQKGVVQCVASLELVLTAVLAGRGVGLIGEGQARLGVAEGIELRPLGLAKAKMTTYLLKRREDPSPVLARFVERAQLVARSNADDPGLLGQGRDLAR